MTSAKFLISPFALLIIVGVSASAAEKRPLSVSDALETTRFASTLQTYGYDEAGDELYAGQAPQFISPNGKRYAALLVRGDMGRNGLWADVVSGSINSFDTISSPRVVASFFTSGKGPGSKLNHLDGSAVLTLPTDAAETFPFTWTDDGEGIALLWEDDRAIKQVVHVNLLTGDRTFLSTHETDVRTFAVGVHGEVLYSARAPATQARTEQMLAHGFAVTQDEVFSLLAGDVDPEVGLQNGRTETFLRRSRTGPALKISSGPSSAEVLRFSPNGRLAIVSAAPAKMAPEWNEYDDPVLHELIAAASEEATQWITQQAVQQMFVLTVDSGHVTPLWNVPFVVGRAPVVRWSPDSQTVLLGPSLLPRRPSSGSHAQEATSLVEVNVSTGDYLTLPVSGVDKASVLSARWVQPDAISLNVGSERRYLRRNSGRWKSDARVRTGSKDRQLRLEVREGLNSPPVLYVVDERSKRAKVLLDPNPDLLKDFKLARVELIGGYADAGWPWAGRLYYPVDFQPGRRYPLVIQCTRNNEGHGYSLYGIGNPGLGPSYSIYAAQVLANRNIAVLQLESIESRRLIDGADQPGVFGTPREAEIQSRMYEIAIDYLSGRGIADPSKVGLAGFSRSGWHVEYALTHSAFKYAAAVASDNMDGSYVQEMLGGLIGRSQHNGAPPSGAGLQQWFARAPGFNADKVSAPLRLVVESLPEGVLFHWEMFSQLKRAAKPVELFVAPDIHYGSHNVQNPRQLLAIKEGAVDWFDFWLNHHEDADPAKQAQYERWRELLELQSRE